MRTRTDNPKGGEAAKEWKLGGYDTFSNEEYTIEGIYPSKQAARKAAKARLADLERTQPTKLSGGRDGIQDRVFIVAPDGSRYPYVPGRDDAD